MNTKDFPYFRRVKCDRHKVKKIKERERDREKRMKREERSASRLAHAR